MNTNSRAALILQLASEKNNKHSICKQNAIEDDDVLMQDLDKSTSNKYEKIQNEPEDPFCTDGNTISDKENVYFEDSDDSVKDPNFKIDCGYKSSTSGSSVGRSTIRNRVKRNSLILSEKEHQTQPHENVSTPEFLDVTPSTSKNIPQRKRSISSDSSSSTSNCSSSSSNSRSSSNSSSSSNVSSSKAMSNCKSPKIRCTSNDPVVSSPLPFNQENNVPSNNASEQVMSPRHKSSKKRKSCVDEWLSNKSKILRNTGKSYTSRSKSQKKMSERCLKPPCGEKCILKCTQKIDDVNRTTIFENYWQLGDLAAQRNFIHKNMKPIIPKFRFTGKTKPRKVNHSFYFHINEEPIRVCKTFFRTTLDINDRVIRTVIEKSKGGFLEQDMRGKHGNHRKVAESIRQGVRDHINSIPRMESHYIRKNSSREYIDGGKSLSDLYRDYRTLCDSNNVAHETLYSRIFNGEFNISFFKPKKDRCELCVRYENAQGDTKKDLEVYYSKHIEEKDLSRLEKGADKKSSGPNKIIAIYDLQAVLQLPRGNTSIFYYKSKLNTFNFTVSQIGVDKTDCFYWHEGEANRGADEIGSCLFKFIENTVVNYDGPGLDLIFYSDNCCGQNKNKFIISIYLYALLKFPKIISVTHKYLITGHTQNEADSVHSTIENQIQRRLRSGPIYVPSQYVEAIKCAKKKGNSYTVTEMSSSDFYSLKRLSVDFGYSIQTAKSFKISEVKIFKLLQEDPTRLLFKTSYKDDQYSETYLTRKKNLHSISLKPAYRFKPKLKENKMKDLLDLLQNNHIPQFYESFYKSLK